MKNRLVGFLILGIATAMGIIIAIFNNALGEIVNTACAHGSKCPMWGTLKFHTNISMLIMGFVYLIGIYLMFSGRFNNITKKVESKEKKQIGFKEISKDQYKTIFNTLDEDEKIVLEKIIDFQGTIFQSELVDKTGLNKVKITRILDKLEGRNILERRRRGMTNIVILKHK